MENEARGLPGEQGDAPGSSKSVGAPTGELLDRIGLIESHPLEDRARGFEQLHDELVTELQRSDHEKA